MKWSNYNNIIVFIQESEQRPLKENVAKYVHFAGKWNTHYAWSKYIQRGREWEERRKDDASAAFHLLKGQQQRRTHPAALLPCPDVIIIIVRGRQKRKQSVRKKFAFRLHQGICEEGKVGFSEKSLSLSVTVRSILQAAASFILQATADFCNVRIILHNILVFWDGECVREGVTES